MAFFLETASGGLMVGMLYALVALGFVLIFKASGVFNFAQGAMAVVTSYLAFAVTAVTGSYFAGLGAALVSGAAHAVAELDGIVVDRYPIREGRFTLLAPDDFHGDTLEVAVLNAKGDELARESLYEDEDAEA